MKVVSVVNYKGGVGKTTFIANIAAKLANEGKKVLLIDLDPQGSLTFSLIHTDEWQRKYGTSKTIKNWFDDTLNNKISNLDNYVITDLPINKGYTSKVPISLITSHLGLFDISMEMAGRLRGLLRRVFVKNKLECLFMLKEGLNGLKEDYDFIFIDCQPSFDMLTQNAIVASDYYLIPTKFDYLSTLGIDSLLFHIENLVNETNSMINEFSFKGYSINPQLLGVAGNMVTIAKNNAPTTFNSNEISKLSEEKYKLFKHSIRNNSEFMDMGGLIPAIAKKADSITRKNIIKEIEDITSEFKERVNK